MAKLWQKDYNLNSVLERFTVGRDYLIDTALIPADCVASTAHAEMLASIGILTGKELKDLKKGFLDILELHRSGSFRIKPSQEDCHTAIESFLTDRLGETGKKIHTGRSRNDQVIAALRLYTRSFLHLYAKKLCGLIEVLLNTAEKYAVVPMPGRTHTQIAMPSSIGLWAAAFAEEFVDSFNLFLTGYDLNNQSPLGSAAGYGVPIDLDREKVASDLGFRKVQNNVLYVNNSRGKFESIILFGIEQACLTSSKLAQDLILFSLPEFGYFSLPDELCSGSSIMPQKKNPDGLELVRARSASVSAWTDQIKMIIRSLPSGYNRDFQETKEPFLNGLETGLGIIEVMTLVIEKLVVKPDNLRKGFTPNIFATDAAIERVLQGMSFRDAYREVGLNLAELKGQDPEEVIKKRTSSGTTGKLNLHLPRKDLNELRRAIEDRQKHAEKAVEKLMGMPVSLL